MVEDEEERDNNEDDDDDRHSSSYSFGTVYDDSGVIGLRLERSRWSGEENDDADEKRIGSGEESERTQSTAT